MLRLINIPGLVLLLLLSLSLWPVNANALTATSADNKYTITYNWDDINDLFAFSIKNNDPVYNSATSADNVYFGSAWGLTNRGPASGWVGYEIPNGDGSEKVGYYTNNVLQEISAGRTRNYSEFVDPSFNLDDLTSGFMLNIWGNNSYNTQANLYAPIEVINGPTVVPEPVSSVLFLFGAGALAGRRYLKRKAA
ncbi:MAG: hypothetical protein HZA16_12560 [Nitrospirae bacterium]|nr:hypothetical protein [Nitrospirota bacterium]